MTIGSLFAGIGGFDLAATRVGWDVRWQVEIDPFCRAVLEKHWPLVRRYEDVRTVGAELEGVSGICGGFPCQDLSSAGKRIGINGERSGLWREFVRIVDVKRPRFVVIENVHHAWRQWVPVLRRALWECGYASLPLRVRACDFGAWHERRRVYLVAHVDPSAVRLESWRSSWPFRAYAPLFADTATDRCGFEESSVCEQRGARRRADTARDVDTKTPDVGKGGLGDSGMERFTEQRKQPTVADVDALRQLQPQGSEPHERRWLGYGRGWEAEPDVLRVVYGVPCRLDGRRMAARIGALGNALIPQIPEWIFRQIQAHEDAQVA